MKIPKVLEKLPDEVRVYGFNFSRQPEITGDPPQTLVDGTGIIVAEPAENGAVESPALDIDTPVVDITNSIVKATFSAGTPGMLYRVDCTVVTSGSATLGMVGNFLVVDPEDLEAEAE